MSTPGPGVPYDAAAALSEPQRLVNIFMAPSKTFLDLRRKPSWWGPWLIAALLSVVFAYLVQVKVGYDQVFDTALKMTPRRAEQLDRLPPDQRQQQVEIATKITQIAVYCSPLVLLLAGIVVAAVLMATLNVIAASEIGFGTALAVVFYSWLPPSMVKMVIVLASMLAPGFAPEGFNIENPVATNLAALMAFPPSSPALYRLASAIDILAIWTIILLGLGFSRTSKVKRSTATLIVAGWYAVVTLLGTAWAALGS